MLPTVILPGYFESADVYLPLQQALTEMGTPTTTVPLRIRDWLPTLSSQSMVPILRQLDRTVFLGRAGELPALVNYLLIIKTAQRIIFLTGSSSSFNTMRSIHLS